MLFVEGSKSLNYRRIVVPNKWHSVFRKHSRQGRGGTGLLIFIPRMFHPNNTQNKVKGACQAPNFI